MDLEKLNERLNSEHNIVNSLEKNKLGNVVVNIKDNVNRPGPKKLDEGSKDLIATLAHFDKESSVAKTFGISQARVSGLKNSLSSSGPTGEYDGEQAKRVEDNIKGVKEKVSKLALSKLESILSGITQDKIDDANLVSITAAASNLSRIAHVEQETERERNNFVFFTPRQKAEDDYEVVNVA